ncbi:bifunctional (p)ppGpp synthetase/guanosine-3',5'-bis(diphosphate) 3'-pyrophosphohydrolase [SAR86 cluster bacterium]|jgi:RelA/SpoT family (p)ppGpp synthetase|nr:bifunctional (p)ppGpp synthetase/guanosine-3',5'-bis(diphosphate) 3'-pyrophosphohydrolase [SAR86 cluster bacterium]
MVANKKSLEKLNKNLSSYLDDSQLEQVNKAYLYAANAHSGQFRSSGDPYVTHPVAVAEILAKFKMDEDCLTAAMLHDVIEDSGIPKSFLKKEFNSNVAELVDGVSKLDKLSLNSKQEEQAENFQKMVMAMSQDIRVIVLKLADRLHNMRTLGFLSEERQKRISLETLEIYAPIAHRLGMHQIYRELEDIAFQVINPYRSRVLKDAIDKKTKGRKKILSKIESSIKEKMLENDIPCQVHGRRKHLYGIFKKMKKQSKSLEEVLDVYAFKITINDVMDCYKVLGILHNSFKPIEGRFKDYIAIPKSNSYQSLHTGIMTFDGLPVEIQIRTNDMDELAEFGVAAHWFYKTGHADNPAQSRARRWVNTLVEVQKNVDDPQDFIDVIKTGLVPNEIYVFTPNGDIVELPKDSTPIDFAFAVHSDIGLHCKGCRINKNLAPLSVPLESGQTINIITDKYPQANPTWLEFVRTSRARSAIRNSTKNLKASKARKFGKNLLEQSLRPHRIKLRNVPKARMSKLLKAINVKSVRELLEQIGSGQRSSLVVAHQIIQFLDYDQKDLIEFSNIQISGSEGLVLSYAACCKPIPGDNIIAHFSNQKGIVIHTERCKNMTSLRKDPAHCAPVQWEDEVSGDFSVEIKIISDDRPGLLAEISASISEANSNIVNFRMDPPAGSSIQMFIIIELKDRPHLAKIMRRLRRLDHVISVSRIHNQDQNIELISK